MAGFDLSWDEASGLIFCAIRAQLTVLDSALLARDLTAMADAARDDGPLRVLWDNRAGHQLPSELAAELRDIMVDLAHPGDRVAILVADSMAKARARPHIDAGAQLFASENAALVWLGFGGALAA